MLDLELIMEEAKIPFYVARCKPGYIAVVLPAAWHQVYNPGPNVADAVNFICHRWEVAAHREYFTCCKNDTKYYKRAMWKPMLQYFMNNESAMGKQWKIKIQQMLENGPTELFEPESTSSILQESQDIFATDAATIEAMDAELEQSQERVVGNETSNEVMGFKTPALIQPSSETMENEETSSFESRENSTGASESSRPLTRQMVEQLEREYLRNPHAARSTAWVEESQQPILIDLNEPVPDADENSAPPAKRRKTSAKSAKKNLQNAAVASSSDTSTTYSPESHESSTESPLDAIDRIIQGRKLYDKQKEYKRKYDKKRKGTRTTGLTRSEYQKQYGNRVQYRRTAIKDVNKILQDHYNGIVVLSSSDYAKKQTTLAKHNTILRATEYQHKLHKALKKAFGETLIQHKTLQGYVSFEIARDYIDGRDPNSRQLFQTAIKDVESSNSTFWEEVTANEAAWNRTFMVDKEFRIPAHFYDNLQ